MSRRAVTPSLEASQRSHVDDLVQRNRAHTATIQKLRQDLGSERDRAKTAVQEIQNKLHADKKEWREAVDVLQISHRIHAYRMQVEVESAKCAVLDEQELLRQEKVAVLQREYTITKFQMQEAALEQKIEELEDEFDQFKFQYKEERLTFKARISELGAHLKMQEEQLTAAEKAKADIEAELNVLQQANTQSQISSESLTVKLERTRLQLEGERSKSSDLGRVNEELKRSNEDLKRQVDKWQSLESKGDSEMEIARKKRVELEVQLQAVQNQLTKREEEEKKVLKKLERAKELVHEWMERAQSLEDLETELTNKLEKLGKENKKLLTQTQSFKKSKIPSDSAIESENEVVQVMDQIVPLSPVVGTSRRKTPLNKQASKPASRQAHKEAAPASPVEVIIPESMVPTRGKGKGKAKAIAADSEPEPQAEPEPPQKQKKPRPKPKPKKPVPARDGSHSGIEDISPETFVAAVAKQKNLTNDASETEKEAQVKRKGKRKASPPPVVDEEQGENRDGGGEPSPAKRRKRNPDGDAEHTKPRVKAGKEKGKGKAPASRAESTASTASVEPEPGAKPGATATRKRKINIFQQQGKMDLANLDFGSQASGIPSVLSPLKPQEGVPARSTTFLSQTMSALWGKR